MLPTTSLKLETLLKRSRLSNEEVEKIVQVFGHYSIGKWVYPGAIHRVTQIPIEKVYEVLNIMEGEGMVKSYFEVICSECKKATSTIYHSIDEIPDEYLCDNCGNEGIASENAVLIYRVVKDE